MRPKSTKEAYESINHSLSQYVDNYDQSTHSPKAIYDDILMVEERYQQSRVINQGGMKKILKTVDSLTGRPVAKATLIDNEDPEKIERFLCEARLTAALEHPNIIPVYDIGVDDIEGPFFTMKLVSGRNLATLLKSLSISKSDTEYSLQNLMEIFLKVCDAIAYAHSRGIVHLDLKPENVQIDEYGEVLVCDWGLAKILEQPDVVSGFFSELDPDLYNGMTLDGFIKGTPGYMAPEQIDNTLGPKNRQTDIYALGGLLYSLLSYKPPTESYELEYVMAETLIGNFLLPSERASHKKLIPPSLEAVAMKALAVDPESRYKSVSELRQEINNWMGGFATEAENASYLTSLWLLINRHKVVAILLALLIFSLIFGFHKSRQNEQRAIANEKAAKVNEQKAIANENKAKEALELFIKEKEFSTKINQYSLDQLLERNEVFLNRFEFDRSYAEIVKSLGFQPNNETLNALKGEVHFYRQEYKEALKSFQSSGALNKNTPYDQMILFADKFDKLKEDKKYIPAADLVSLIYSFSEKYQKRLFAFEASKYRLHDNQLFEQLLKTHPFIDNHLEFCRSMIMYHSDNKNTLKFKYSLDKDGINLDLSGSNWGDSFGYLRHLPLKSLNLDDSQFYQKWVFRHYHLKSLSIRKCGIKKITQLDTFALVQKSKLKKIYLTKEQYDISELSIRVKSDIQFIVD